MADPRDPLIRPRLMVVEDEETLRVSLVDRFTAEGFDVTACADGDRGFELLKKGPFEVAILDVMLPGKQGFDIVRDLRAAGVQVPVLMLTARREVIDRVVGLRLGADDYVVKPFDMAELSARIDALLRRARSPISAATQQFSFGEITINFGDAVVDRLGEPIALSALDYRLLCYFVEHRGSILSRDQLLDEVWGYDTTLVTRTVDVHVSTLRQKLEPIPENPRYIQTVHGRGYKFTTD